MLFLVVLAGSDEIDAMRDNLRGSLRVGSMPSMSPVLPVLVQLVRQRHPGVVVDVQFIGSDAMKVGLDNFSTGKRANLSSVANDVEIIAGDLGDEEIVKRAVAGVSVVFHQAALASVPRSVEDPLATHAACVTGTY